MLLPFRVPDLLLGSVGFVIRGRRGRTGLGNAVPHVRISNGVLHLIVIQHTQLALAQRGGDAEQAVDKWVLDHYTGISPLIAREFAFRAGHETDVRFGALNDAQRGALVQEFSDIPSDAALVLMGHGTEHPANATYPALDYRLKARGCKNFFVGTVEGYPDLQTVMQEVAAIHASKVFLAPLMVVAGDHAINDLCGEEEDSWKSCFEQAGYQTEPILKGLGEYPAFRRIYLEHCVQCIQSLESEQ